MENKKENNGKIVEISKEMLEMLEEIREGYREALGLELSYRQASYILVNKLKKKNITGFKFP